VFDRRVSAVEGFVRPGYEPVRDALWAALARGEERGGAVCVTRGGEVVVDLWAGLADREARRPWAKDTIIVFFSATKGLAAMLLLDLAARGRFEYDAPLHRYWPEMLTRAKAGLTVRTLLNHRGGLAGLDTPLSMEDVTTPARYPKVVAAMEGQHPLWAPGTRQGYHATTYGLFVTELIRRVAPELEVSRHFRARFAEPLGAEVWLGAPPEVDARVATLYPPSPRTRVAGMGPAMLRREGAEGHVARTFLTPGSLTRRAFTNPIVEHADLRVYNTIPVRRAALLWASGVGNARGLARVYAPLANDSESFGVRLFDPRDIGPLYARQSWSRRDLVLGKPLGWSQGFLKEEPHVFCPNPESFGHAGLGGALGWADPVARASFGYVTNTLDWRVRSKRCTELCQALYASPAMRERPSVRVASRLEA